MSKHVDIAKRKCARWRFTPEHLGLYRTSFWPMPPEWGSTDGTSMLKRIWTEGGVGAVSILPVLGQFAHSLGPKGVTYSKEELARLAGIHPATVATAASALKQLELASSSTVLQHGIWVTRWKLYPALAALKGVRGRLEDYFSVPLRFIYGGNWAQLTGVQRALYLAIGTQSRVFEDPPERNSLLNSRHVKKSDRVDMHRAWEYSTMVVDGVSKHYNRLTCLSITELCVITGMARSTVVEASNELKHPYSWPECGNNPRRIHYNPIGVAPTVTGSLVYYFRDHAEPWPWEYLNGEPSKWDDWIDNPDTALIGRR